MDRDFKQAPEMNPGDSIIIALKTLERDAEVKWAAEKGNVTCSITRLLFLYRKGEYYIPLNPSNFARTVSEGEIS